MAGDGWTILHGDTLQIIRPSSPGFDALSPTRPTLRAAGNLRIKPHDHTKYSSMAQRKTPHRLRWGQSGPEKLDPLDGRVAVRCPQSLQAGCARLPVHRLAAVPLITDALQWAGWIWRGCVVWDKLTCRPQKRTVPPAERIHCVGV